MSKHYGDLPCVNLNGTIHITVSGTKCLCGGTYTYGRPTRAEKKCVNIIWRKPEAVTCVTCKGLYMASLISNKDLVVVSSSDTTEGIGYKGTPSIDETVL